MNKILIVFGTRPELIKLFPIIISKNIKNKITVCNTGQHKEMVDGLLKIFKIKPDINLNVMKNKQPLTSLFNKIFNNLNKVILKSRPRVIIVHGDTISAAAAALVGFYNKIKVFHIEAGLRTYNNQSPYPEEFNRQIISRATAVHFAPTKFNRDILKAEKVNGKVLVSGNTVLDALKITLKNNSKKIEDNIMKKYKINFKKKFILITIHRREILGKKHVSFLLNIKKLMKNFPEINFFYVMHKNPIARQPAIKFLNNIKNVKLINHLDYDEFSFLLSKCYFVITDSGGLQEEAPFLKKPVIVVRSETERVEALKLGTIKLVGYNFKILENIFYKLVKNKKYFMKMISTRNPYGNGNSAKIIEKEILKNIT